MRSPIDIKEREIILEYIDKIRNMLVPEPITELEFEENRYAEFKIEMAERDLIELGE